MMMMVWKEKPSMMRKRMVHNEDGKREGNLPFDDDESTPTIMIMRARPSMMMIKRWTVNITMTMTMMMMIIE